MSKRLESWGRRQTPKAATLPETESSPRVGSFGESQISSSRWSPSSPRAQGLALGEGLAHGVQHLRRELSTLSSRRRVRLTAPQPQPSRPPTSVKFVESLEVRLSVKKKHTAQKHFHREHYTFDGCFVSAYDEFSKKITFSSPNFFLDPHTLIQYTCSKLAPFCLC
jgi:hypothetical protein